MDNIPAYVVGIDIGGTNIRLAVADANDTTELLERRLAVTPTTGRPDDLIDLVASEVSKCLKEAGVERYAVRAIGCSVPGIVDVERGVVQLASNLKWTDVPLADLLTKRLGVEAFIENDVRAAAFAEYTHGAGKGCSSLVYFTVSTGVSVGIVLHGRVLRGHHQAAGEIAYLVPAPELLDHDWGLHGCLEANAAGVGLARQWAAHRHIPEHTTSAAAVFQAAEAGDPAAQELIDRAAAYLAQASLAVGAIVDPEVLVLGGSIAQHQASIFNRIRSVVASTLPFEVGVVPAALGGDAPLIGSLAIAADGARAIRRRTLQVQL